MKKLIVLFWLALAPVLAFSQGVRWDLGAPGGTGAATVAGGGLIGAPPSGSLLATNNVWMAKNVFTLGAVLGPTTVAGLSFLSPSDGTTVVVIDPATSGSCTVGAGNGSFHSLCVYDAATASWVSAGSSGSGLPSGCTGSTGAISCNSTGVAFNAPNGGIAANYIQGNSNTLPNRVSIGDNATQCSLIAGAFNFCPILGVMHVFDETGADLLSLLTGNQLGALNGVAGLNGSGVVNPSELATNPANCNSTTFFRGDNTCNAPNALANAFQAPNYTLSSGTTLNELAAPGPTAGTVTTAAGSGFNAIGVCTAGCGNTGTATIQFFGSVPLVFDNGPTNGDYVVASTTTGQVHDAGAVLANVGTQQLIGVALATNAVAGTYNVWLIPIVGRHVVAQGTTSMATSAITSGACATVVTATATGADASKDNLSADFNGDPTATTGYAPSATGTLNIYKYITGNAVNFKVCNSTGATITPGSVTLKWSVWR